MFRLSKIVVVGSLIVDITAYTPHFPVEGETTLGNSLNMGPGGKGNNQATAAARSGGEVIMISKWGRDVLSDILKKHYRDEGMTVRYISESETEKTGSALIEVDSSGHNRIVVIKGANEAITADEVRLAENEFAGCDAVLCQLETSIESVLEAKRLANKYGKRFVLNPAPFQSVPEELFYGVDYITPNETEAEFFTGIPVKDEKSAGLAALEFKKMGVKNVIITLGKRGVFYSTDTKSGIVPTTDLKPVDTTGAGDAFNGGFTVAMAEGKDIETALKFANCVASISVTRRGAAPAMPNRAEAVKLLSDYYGVEY